MNKELAIKVMRALEEAKVGYDPDSDDLRPIAEQLGAILSHGCTRWAFVFTKHQTVVKIPKFDETDDDYCLLELENYNKAKEYRVEKCLLPIEFVGSVDCGDHDLPVYIQPMYTTSHDSTPYDIRQKWAEKVKTLHNKPIMAKVEHGCLYRPPHLWLERAVQIYGKRFMREFQKWTRDCKVNDLHSGNVGWLGKQPIIIDYAGYHG